MQFDRALCSLKHNQRSELNMIFPYWYTVTLLIQTIENSIWWIEFSIFLGLFLRIIRFLLKSKLIEWHSQTSLLNHENTGTSKTPGNLQISNRVKTLPQTVPSRHRVSIQSCGCMRRVQTIRTYNYYNTFVTFHLSYTVLLIRSLLA